MLTRKLCKRAAKTGFLMLLIPVYLLCELLSLIGERDSIFQSFSQALSLIPGKIGVYSRAAFYRLACLQTSDDISIGFLTVLSHRDTTLHPGVYIGPGGNIGKCSIGSDTLLGSGVHILSGSRQHEFNDPTVPIKHQGGHFEKIRIGADCWLGNNAVVMCPLPDKTLVAAGSVVTRSGVTGDILAGNPARVVRNRLLSDAANSQPHQRRQVSGDQARDQ